MTRIKQYAEDYLNSSNASNYSYNSEDLYLAVYGYESELSKKLKNLHGIYMLEFIDGSRYVGSAFHEEGMYNRIKTYMKYSAGSGNPLGNQAKKDALPKSIQDKFATDRENFLTDDEDYLTFHILHTVEAIQDEQKYGIFDGDSEILSDMLEFVGDEGFTFYRNLNDNQAEEKYFKELFDTKINGLNLN
ncbi:hypothetical protein [Floricoccus penangensis]|uniref:hypothetical protein n=1 Tax=Floricoccus penangensis TaxID=1859475 RepID=UPI00203DF616|nr:hypothetical protein [Floricoccus penangensis]URZ87813.1 hypothetical protein KIW23_01825 [Floricoccus penangensis]